MMYLGIFVAVALVGIGGIWWSQKRQFRKANSVEGFRTSLERISTGTIVTGKTSSSIGPRSRSGARRPAPLDPARREAAKRRLERRRAARP